MAYLLCQEPGPAIAESFPTVQARKVGVSPSAVRMACGTLRILRVSGGERP